MSVYERARFFSNNDRNNLLKAIKHYYLNVEGISIDISSILQDRLELDNLDNKTKFDVGGGELDDIFEFYLSTFANHAKLEAAGFTQ